MFVDYSKPASAKDIPRVERARGIAVPDKKSLLVVGSTVVLCPDADGQAKDQESGYKLGLNIGRIVAIDHDLNSVELWWYFGTGWSDPNWILWRDPKSKRAYKDWVLIDDLVCDEFDHIVRINMESVGKKFKFKLSKASVKEIKRCVSANKHMLKCEQPTAEESDQAEFDEQSE